VSAPPNIRNLLISLEAEQRGNIGQFSEFLANFLAKERTIGKKLKIAIRMFVENIKQLSVYQWLSTKNSKKIGSLFLTLFDDEVDFLDIQMLLPTIGTYPASLAPQVTIVRYRDKLKSREELSPLLSFFEFPKTQKTLPNHICEEFIPHTAVGMHKIGKKRHKFIFF
jgi:hypothetical protein